MMVEIAMYLVASLVDWLKWWRFLSAVLVSGFVFVGCAVFGAIPKGSGWMVFVGLLCLGVVTGITLEWYAQRHRRKVA